MVHYTACLHRQRQRLINTTETRVNRITNGDSDSAARALGRRGLENGIGNVEQGLNGRCRLQQLESGVENENEDNENNENDEEGEGEDDNEGPLVPFRAPGTEQVACRDRMTIIDKVLLLTISLYVLLQRVCSTS